MTHDPPATQTAHHEVFDRFEQGARRIVNWLGVSTRRDFFAPELRFVTFSRPPFDTEYFEWVDVLEAVTQASERFTMLEVGAGYGRWLVNAAAALRLYSGIRYRLIGVEAEPTHFRWMKAHCRENGVKRASRRGTCRLVHAAVAPQSGQAWFYIGKAPSWYGQAIASDKTTDDETARAKVRAVTLSHLLRPLDVVDLIHLDIQGTESEVLQEAATQLDKKVRRVHIGTHASAIEDELRSLFGGLGWTSLNDYGCGTDSHTPWGRMTFQDGIQTWVNARLARDDRR